MDIAPADTEVLLCYESFEEPFNIGATEMVTDVRIVDDWPLPGTSVITYEEKPKKVILFYSCKDNRE